MKELIEIQSTLKVKKTRKGPHYNYRSAEDILLAVKPELKKHGCILTLSDTMITCGDRVYVQSTARISKGEGSVEVTGLAREGDKMAAMSDPQITGSCSSYARKYALGGLFLLDDSEDVDGIKESGIGPIHDWQIEEFNKMLTRLSKIPDAVNSVELIKNNLSVWNSAEAETWMKKIKGKYGV